MTTFGTLKTNTETGELTGNLTTLTFVKQLRLVPINRKDQNTPVYRVIVNDAELGAVWEKTARATGQVYHSMMLDSPELPTPLHLAMFPTKDRPGFYDLTWNRQKPQTRIQADPADNYGSEV
jgi:uncharacterized protein (DUF736 family)